MYATLLASVDNLDLYAIKVLRSHGMCVDALKDIYRTVVLAKLLYASPACSPLQPINNASKHSSVEVFGSACMAAVTLLQPNLLRTPTKDCSKASSTASITSCKQFLPEHNSHSYCLRPRRHNFSLATKTGDRNFVTRQLFTNIYWTNAFNCNSVGIPVRFLLFMLVFLHSLYSVTFCSTEK